MNIVYNVSRYSVLALLLFIFYGCSAEDDGSTLLPIGNVPVKIEINSTSALFSRALGDDNSYSVNRILILPFKKIDESYADIASSYAPVYTSAKQLDVNRFTVLAAMLSLESTSTYRVIVIGYNRNDYDFQNQASISNRFTIGSVSAPVTLANFHLQPKDPTVVPEFFTTVCNAYTLNNANMGISFKPSAVARLQGNLTRLVSGLTIQVSNIPAFVTGITLEAEQLVNATIAVASDPADVKGTPSLWQLAGDGGNKVLGTAVPVAGQVVFNKYLLPTLDSRKTLFYLTVAYGIFTERYTIIVADQTGVSSANRILFSPNQVVKISGDYNLINFGFRINANINLDDNNWDGLQ